MMDHMEAQLPQQLFRVPFGCPRRVIERVIGAVISLVKKHHEPPSVGFFLGAQGAGFERRPVRFAGGGSNTCSTICLLHSASSC